MLRCAELRRKSDASRGKGKRLFWCKIDKYQVYAEKRVFMHLCRFLLIVKIEKILTDFDKIDKYQKMQSFNNY